MRRHTLWDCYNASRLSTLTCKLNLMFIFVQSGIINLLLECSTIDFNIWIPTLRKQNSISHSPRPNEIPWLFSNFSSRVGNGQTRYWRLWAEAHSAKIEPRSGERGGAWEGVHPPVKGVRGVTHGKFWKTSMQICAFWALLEIKFEFVMYADSMAQTWFPWLCLFSWFTQIPWLFHVFQKSGHPECNQNNKLGWSG